MQSFFTDRHMNRWMDEYRTTPQFSMIPLIMFIINALFKNLFSHNLRTMIFTDLLAEGVIIPKCIMVRLVMSLTVFSIAIVPTA